MSVAFDDSTVDDAVVLGRVRSGQAGAYGLLYQRHVGAARRLARSLVSSAAEADDIVAEVFAATFGAISRGRGPESEFVPYILRSVRHECRRSWRRTSPQRQTSLDESGEDLPSWDPDDFARTDEQEVLHDAFVALSPRMRSVLWQVEVEGLSHDEIARRTHSTPQAIAQLVVRARRVLSERYLQAHLAGAPVTALATECAATRACLAEYVRGTVCARRRRSVAEHLATCPACREACDDLELVNERLRGVLVLTLATTAVAPRPWVLGVVARATSWLLGPTAPLTVATGMAVLTVIAPPPVFEPTPPAATAAPTTDGPTGFPSDPADVSVVRPPGAASGPALDAEASTSVVASAVIAAVAGAPVGAPSTVPAPTAPLDGAVPTGPAPPSDGNAPPLPVAPVTVPPVAAPLDAIAATVPAVVATVTSVVPALLDPLVPSVDLAVDVPTVPRSPVLPIELPPVGAAVSIGDAGATVDVEAPVLDLAPVVVPSAVPLLTPTLDGLAAVELPTPAG